MQLINRELDEYLGGIQGEFDADTRFAITWFEQNGMAAGDYGIANSIATARGISVDSVKHAGIVDSAAGKVRILQRDEINADWDPAADTHLTVWECCQHLIRGRCHVNHRVTSLWAPTPEIMQRSSVAATVSSRRRGIGGVFGGRPDGVGR